VTIEEGHLYRSVTEGVEAFQRETLDPVSGGEAEPGVPDPPGPTADAPS
jgi:hypothetical protein